MSAWARGRVLLTAGQVVRAGEFVEDFIVYDVPRGDAEPPSPVLRPVSSSDEESAHA